MKLTLKHIAVEWLNFPPRIRAGLVTRHSREVFANCLYKFHKHIEKRCPNSSLDDIHGLCVQYFKEFATYWDWYRSVFSYTEIAVIFQQSEPQIGIDRFIEWRQLSFELDPDALLCFEFVRKYGRAMSIDDIKHWRLHAGPSVRLLRYLFAEGLGDIHTHLGGCASVAYKWHVLVEKNDKRQLYKNTPYIELKRITTNASYAERDNELRAEASIIESAIQAWAVLKGKYSAQWKALEHESKKIEKNSLNFERGSKKIDTWISGHEEFVLEISPVSKQLQRERAFISFIWQKAQSDTADMKLLDAYISGKNMYLRRNQQFPGRNPGLRNFRKYFNRSGLEGIPYGHDKKKFWNNVRQLLYSALDTPTLRLIELRMSPFNTLGEYKRFFSEFSKLINEKGIENEDLAGDYLHDDYLDRKNIKPIQSGICAQTISPGSLYIGFVVHFIRKPDEAHDHTSEVEFENLRRDLDKKTALLQEFRVKYPELARWIRGVDVASLERNCLPEIFVPYINLLRTGGDQQSLQLCYGSEVDERDFFSSPYLERWKALREEGHHQISPQLEPLGLTYHAGEDFFYPIGGLRAIWNLINYANMRTGDRIGHGLALGADMLTIEEEADMESLIPRGRALDSLVWLYVMIDELHPEKGTHLRKIKRQIELFSLEIFGEIISLDILYASQKLRHLPALAHLPNSSVLPEQVEFWRMETTDHKIREKRMALIQRPEIFAQVAESSNLVQARILNIIKEHGIGVEINPSSNWSTGAITHIDLHPVIKKIPENKDLRLTINCDDPGTFATSLEVEYALVFHALLKCGLNEAEAISLLSQFRCNALHDSF